MQFLSTLSLAPRVNDWWANSRQPHILHVFDNVCNLVNESREILSIVTPQIGNGPFNLVVENNVLFSKYITLESPTAIFENQLTLEGLTVDVCDAKLWNPRPAWEKLYLNRESVLTQLSSMSIVSDQPLLPYSLISSFSSALVDANISSAINITSRLAGLGQGLTPAGDDFIMGAIYAAWIIHPSQVARILAKEITNTAAPLTTSLSAEWLRSAGRGEAGITWHEFFEALISADPIHVQEAIDKILAVGETSGADAMAGFMSIFISSTDIAGP